MGALRTIDKDIYRTGESLALDYSTLHPVTSLHHMPEAAVESQGSVILVRIPLLHSC